jgi:hypothetical protein
MKQGSTDMRQLNTITVTCRDCQVEFTHETRSNRPKLLCDACLLESQRKATREYMQRKRAANRKEPQHLGCRDCGKPWDEPRHRASSCTDCRAEANREYQRQLRAANPTPPRVFICARCKAKIIRVGKSGTATYCEACKPAIKKQHQQRTAARRREKLGTSFATHCHYCKVEFDKPKQRAKVPNRCDECQKERHRAYIRVYYAKQPRGFDHARRARKMGLGYERFTVMEIFERDCWKCGICRKRINQRLRYPHPMSASLDHKKPLAKGGTHSRLNVQAAHLRCNLKKRTHVAPLGEQIPLPI